MSSDPKQFQIPEQSSGSGGCLKVLAIALPLIALTAFLFWKVSQSAGRGAEVSERVVGSYLKLVQAGAYQQALDAHGSDAFRKQVTAEKLKAEYDKLAKQHGRFVSYELYIAQEQHAIGSDSIVRAKYTLKFEKAEEHVAYDISGEGDAAKIAESYDRVAGRDMLTKVPR